ncbi:MAG: cobalt-precorrin-6A reductase [Rhodospirillales bacterium]|nr:cobalt-precorrin-6A reductase [Rhodospirillales bacterium]MDH3911704.1 cobalt-precorrin-6A reductase [Rhodospirillales bacterium]MDH3918364.1 cobalt-precorrin-6A reductase [Rhodospirillales bacterium]MDH3969157.1 cobalt-precorrin-6A reductase [Rhodospirillales bacterium]
MARLLLLGGTAEALELARSTAGDPGLHTVTSLAGRTRRPAEIPGEVRVGGFGGAEGLARHLQEQAIDLLVDATHPFAVVMARNAAQACHDTGVPRLKLLRPAWRPAPGDLWLEAADAAAAAAGLSGLGGRFFLTTGLRDIAAFAGLEDPWFLVRLIDRPEAALPLARHDLILARGPFAEAAEVALMRGHRIEALIAKNSGGYSTYAKIAAARRLGLPVVMIRRPKAPAGEMAETVDQVLAWIAARTGRGGPS